MHVGLTKNSKFKIQNSKFKIQNCAAWPKFKIKKKKEKAKRPYGGVQFIVSFSF